MFTADLILLSKAELSISLRNVGDEKYKADLYGNRIIIERKLAKDGQSIYRIFNDASKQVIRTKNSCLECKL